MKTALILTSILALIVTIAPAVMFLGGSLSLDQTKVAMLAGTIVWFVVTPTWMGRSSAIHHEEVI